MEKDPVPPLREGRFDNGGRNHNPMTPRPKDPPAAMGIPWQRANAADDEKKERLG
jgi:hypothetical protein